MAKFKVWGRSVDRITREPIGKVRTEIINTKTNNLFKYIENPKRIEEKYEAFWNDLNPNSKEIVKVIGVKKVK